MWAVLYRVPELAENQLNLRSGKIQTKAKIIFLEGLGIVIKLLKSGCNNY